MPPLFLGSYWFNAILIPFLIFAMAAFGLNILVGYCGQISLGTGGFMAVGAYASYKFDTVFFPDLGMIFIFLMSGSCGGRGRGAVRRAEPAHQGLLSGGRDAGGAVLLDLALHRVPWFSNYSSNGTIESPPRTLFGAIIEPGGMLQALDFLNPLVDQSAGLAQASCLRAHPVIVFALIAKNLVRGRIGRRGWPSATWTSPPS